MYELQTIKEYRTYWVFIIDLTVELGKQKYLVILGVSQQYLKSTIFPEKRGLKHHDVQLLALEIMDSTRGELIEKKLCELTDMVGCPVQIIADHGSDIAKGIKLENVRYLDLLAWSSQVFGQSTLSKRKTVFSTSIDDTVIV
ncbi:hypothetical protein IQ275_16215 [Nostoc sp. LEGE 12450]|nr:hypothetical protein [Nostoc sp. LEGE 12450]